MANEPRFKFPDMHYDVSKGQLPSGGGQITSYFGPSRFQDYEAREGMPLDALTLAKAYEGANTYVSDIIHNNFVYGNGWYFTLSPLKRLPGLNQRWQVVTFDRQAMEPAPEDTTARTVTYRVEDHVETLTRFSIGADAKHDFFKTPEGQAIMEANLQQMISGGWITAKIITTQAVFNSKLHWQEQHAQFGPSYTNVMDALDSEIRLFGALSKDEKGIYKLHEEVKELSRDANPPYDMIVFARGVQSFIALSSDFETEGYRRGTAIVNRRLTLGARSIEGLLPNVTIYEDEVYNLTNVGPDEINQFIRIAVIGRYFMVDGSDFGEHMDSYHSAKHLSVKAASMDVDDYKLFKIDRLIDASMRFKPGNEGLRDELYTLAEDAESILQRTGIKLHHPDYLDPYIWRSHHDGRYHVIRFWGEMDKYYLSQRQTELHGEAACKLLKKKFDRLEGRWPALQKLKEIRDRLYNVPNILDNSISALAFGLEALNHPGSKILKANRHGFVDLPTKAGGNLFVGDRKIFVAYYAGTKVPYEWRLGPADAASIRSPGPDITDFEPARAPALPYGFGPIAGLRTLAQMHKDNDPRGWDPKLLAEVSEGLESLDALIHYGRKWYPDCILFDERYTPAHVAGPDRAENEKNSVIANLWDAVEPPVWGRVTRDSDVGRAVRTNVDQAEGGGSVTAVSQNEVDRIWAAMGGADVEEPAAKDLLAAILSSKYMDQDQLQNVLKHENRTLEAFKNYSATIGPQFVAMQSNSNDQPQDTKFIWIFVLYIYARYAGAQQGSESLKLHKATEVFSDLLRESYVPQGRINVGLPVRSSPEGLRRFLGTAESRAADHHAVNKEDDAPPQAASTARFVNLRIVFSGSSWRSLGNSLTAENEATYASSLVRPTDPSNATAPLVTSSPAAVSRVLSRHRNRNVGSMSSMIFNTPSLMLKRELYNLGNASMDSDDSDDDDDGSRGRKRPLEDDGGSVYYTNDDATSVSQSKNLMHRIDKLSEKAPDEVSRLFAGMFCFSRVTRRSLKNWIKHDLPSPDSCIIVAQPWIRLRTSAGIWAVSGEKTAQTGYNYEDVVLQFNGVNKTWHMHYTIWLNSAVYDPTQLCIMKDIKFEGYIGGMDDTFNDDLTDWDPQNIDFARVRSCFAFSCGSMFTRDVARKLANPLPLFGRYDPKALPFNFADRNRIFSPDGPVWPSYPYYAHLWGLPLINTNTSLDYSTYASTRESTYITGLMPMCNHLLYDPVTQDYTKKVRGTGHLDWLEPPMRHILNGKVEFHPTKIQQVY